MTMDGFTARVTVTDTGSRIELAGTVNRMAKEALESAYTAASQSSGEIALDFTNVDYINSTGIAVIVGVLAMARAEERSMGAYGLSDHYREVFEITRLADFIHIHETSDK
jgi:anti-sigma B factor antagonist